MFLRQVSEQVFKGTNVGDLTHAGLTCRRIDSHLCFDLDEQRTATSQADDSRASFREVEGETATDATRDSRDDGYMAVEPASKLGRRSSHAVTIGLDLSANRACVECRPRGRRCLADDFAVLDDRADGAAGDLWRRRP